MTIEHTKFFFVIIQRKAEDLQKNFLAFHLHFCKKIFKFFVALFLNFLSLVHRISIFLENVFLFQKSKMRSPSHDLGTICGEIFL